MKSNEILKRKCSRLDVGKMDEQEVEMRAVTKALFILILTAHLF